MRVIKFVLFVCLVGFVLNYLGKDNIENKIITSEISDYGFVSLPKPNSLNTNNVIILAAKNCTKKAALRADRLANELADRNIPYTRISRINFQNYTPSMKNNLDTVMGGPMPHVLVYGKGKANPTLKDVLSEYDSNTKNSGDSILN